MFKTRIETKKIRIGSLELGGSDHVLIQSMCNIKTAKTEEVAAQINRCAKLGADIMRVSVLDEDDARSIPALKEATSIPLVADIHFRHDLALLCIEGGIDAIRINPGNIGDEGKIQMVLDEAKAKGIPIRIGVNSGSLDPALPDSMTRGEKLIASAKKHVAICEKFGFNDLVLSLKGSNIRETVEAYRLAAATFPYPLHLGITEAGPAETGLLRSAAGLSPLLLDGIGDTIRISLSEEPEEEIKACKRLLHDLGLYPDFPTFISCPTCGRTQVDLVPLAKRVRTYCEEHCIPKTVAVMGCIVNGPGEAKEADVGLAGGKGTFALFKKGKVVATIPEPDAFSALIKAIEED